MSENDCYRPNVQASRLPRTQGNACSSILKCEPAEGGRAAVAVGSRRGKRACGSAYGSAERVGVERGRRGLLVRCVSWEGECVVDAGPTRGSGRARAQTDASGRALRSRNEEKLLARSRQPRWRPGAVEQRGDLGDVGDGANDPHGTVAAPAAGDIAGEHAREKRSPPDAGRRALVRQRGPRLPRPQAGGVEQHPLHGSCGGRRTELRCNALGRRVLRLQPL